MKLTLKTTLAALAGAAAITAAAAPYERYYGSNDRTYAYTYDRYGNAYDRHGKRIHNPRFPDPGYAYVDPWLDQPTLESRNWEYTFEDPRERASRIEIERAHRGDYDGVTPHPLSKNYSPG